MSFRIATLISIILLAGSVHARQTDVYTGFTFVFPQEPAPKVAPAKPAQTNEQEEERRAYMREMHEVQIENARIETFILAMRYKRYRDEQPPIDPEKDEYRKYRLELQRMQDDPDYAKLRTTRDDFKAWKDSPQYKALKESSDLPHEPKDKGRNIDALAKALNSTSLPEKKSAAKQKENDE